MSLCLSSLARMRRNVSVLDSLSPDETYSRHMLEGLESSVVREERFIPLGVSC